MTLKRREFTREFKLRVVAEADGAGRAHRVNANTVAKRRKQLRKYPERATAFSE